MSLARCLRRSDARRTHRSAAQDADHLAREAQALGHDADHTGQKSLGEKYTIALEAFIKPALRLALRGDDLVLADIEPLASRRKLLAIGFVAECLGEPIAQCARCARLGERGLDHRPLTGFER